jgi:DNA-binding NtrC family response regulator
MSNLAQNEFRSARRNFRQESAAPHRRRPLSVLFIHRDADTVDNCMEELKKAQFTVSADLVLTLAQCTQQLHRQNYDLVVAEYPSPNWKSSQALQLLHQTVQEIPLVFVTTAMGKESIAELTPHGTFDYVEREHLAQIPITVRRLLNDCRELPGPAKSLSQL